MRPQHPGERRPLRPGRREEPSLVKQLLRRCVPHSLLHRGRRSNIPSFRRRLLCVLVTILALLVFTLTVLLVHLFVMEIPFVANTLHLGPSTGGGRHSSKKLPIASATPETLAQIQQQLHPHQRRTRGPEPRRATNGFLSTYFDLEERATPRLTKKVLEAWFAHTQDPAAGGATPGADVSEEVLLRNAQAHDDDDSVFFDALAFLYPPAQQQEYYRAAMNDILKFGTRVGGAQRDPLLRHLVSEGLGQRFYDAQERRYRNAPHLNPRGKALLEKAAGSWPSAPTLTSAAGDAAAVPARVAGWRWSLLWDNFTTTVPLQVEGQWSPTVAMQNLVFQFPGGSQFRRKRAALEHAEGTFVGHRQNPEMKDVRSGLALDEHHPLDLTDQAVYTQESFVSRGRHSTMHGNLPDLQRGVPGTKAVIRTPGRPVPLKPSLSAPVAQPVSQQPVQHAVFAAHWDSKLEHAFRFLGACDSAVPMVYLLRSIKSIALLTDVAELLTETFKEELGLGDGPAPPGVTVPGLSATFRNSTTEAVVRQRLASLLSPAHHALLYQYVFARPYTVGADHADQPPGSQNHPSPLEVDVRMWLDWVQHLPTLSFVLFDGEETFTNWGDGDNTYGSRHLAEQWRTVTSLTRTRYSGGAQSLFDTVDLFSLYDLMGTAGTSFSNIYPTQSGIYYAALAQKEYEHRQRAFRHSSAITAELLWRAMDTEKQTGDADGFLRQLGPIVESAIASVNRGHVQSLLADPASRPSAAALPRAWLLYGAPHEMLTLHRVTLAEFRGAKRSVSSVVNFRQHDIITPSLMSNPDFNPARFMEDANRNIFFAPQHADLVRHHITHVSPEDDHLPWLDTQRVLHLISFPFPDSWHKESDDGRDIHDGTTVDLGGVLWSTLLELGHFWTGEGQTR